MYKTKRLQQVEEDARVLSMKLRDLADDLFDASKDYVSLGDVSLAALSAAEAFVREHKNFLERM